MKEIPEFVHSPSTHNNQSIYYTQYYEERLRVCSRYVSRYVCLLQGNGVFESSDIVDVLYPDALCCALCRRERRDI